MWESCYRAVRLGPDAICHSFTKSVFYIQSPTGARLATSYYTMTMPLGRDEEAIPVWLRSLLFALKASKNSSWTTLPRFHKKAVFVARRRDYIKEILLCFNRSCPTAHWTTWLWWHPWECSTSFWVQGEHFTAFLQPKGMQSTGLLGPLRQSGSSTLKRWWRGMLWHPVNHWRRK